MTLYRLERFCTANKFTAEINGDQMIAMVYNSIGSWVGTLKIC